LSLKPRSNDDDDGDDDNDEDTVIASASKNHNNHNVVFFAPVVVAVEVEDDGGTRPRGRPLMLTPFRVSCQRAKEEEGRGPIVVKDAELQRLQQR
jgi:hypothetical protein